MVCVFMMSLSKEKLEFYTNKIPFERCLDYGLEKVSKAASIDLIKGIIGGPNMKYKCIELEQSFFVYHVMRDNLIEVCEKLITKYCLWRLIISAILMDYWLSHWSQSLQNQGNILSCGVHQIYPWYYSCCWICQSIWYHRWVDCLFTFKSIHVIIIFTNIHCIQIGF